MDKLFLDTNYLLDLAVKNRPGADAAALLFEMACDGRVAGVISPTSLKDFYFIARRDMPETTRRRWISLFMDAFVVAGLDRNTCAAALSSDEPDFEDGMIRAGAEAEGCDLIISRDTNAFGTSPITRKSPEEYVAHRGA